MNKPNSIHCSSTIASTNTPTNNGFINAYNETNNQLNRKRKSPQEEDDEAHAALVHALASDLPLLMHGSGDVHPSSVSPSSALLLAQCTANYIKELVNAAVDAHDMKTDGNGTMGILPPLPRVLSAHETDNHEMGMLRDQDSQQHGIQMKKSVWEDNHDLVVASKTKKSVFYPSNNTTPPPYPYINNNNNTRPNSSSSTAEKAQQLQQQQQQDPESTSLNWQGIAPVDFFQTHRYDKRIRRPHNGGLNITTQSFLFPICHDAELYGKVKDLQAARRTLLNDLWDPILLDVMKEECNSNNMMMMDKANNSKDGSGSGGGGGTGSSGGGASSGGGGSSNSGAGGAASSSSNAIKKKSANHIPGGHPPLWPEADYILPTHVSNLNE